MAVGGAEAPGAGATNVVVADNTPPTNVVSGNPPPVGSTGQGSAGSPGGQMAPLSTQPGRRTNGAQAAHLRADEAPLQTGKIAKTLTELNTARRAYDEAPSEKKEEAWPNLVKAERTFDDAIRAETKRLSRPSRISPLGNARDVRTVERRIVETEGWLSKSFRDAIRNIERGRLPYELRGLGSAMRHGSLTSEQKQEMTAILDGASNFVLNEPLDSSNIDAAALKSNQLARLRGLVKSGEEVDSKFATSALFAMMVIRCADGMHLAGYADLRELRGIVEYRNAAVSEWIVKRENSVAVGGAEAPGAGSANVVVADNMPPAHAAPANPSPASSTARKVAASPGGQMPPVSTQPERRTDAVQAADLPAGAADRIEKALSHLDEAEKKLIAAGRIGDELTRRKAKDAANREIEVAERELSDAIRQEAEKLSRPSPLAASVSRHASAHHGSAHHGSARHASARHAGDMRQAEARIRDAFPSVVGNATRDIDRGLLPDELGRLSVAMGDGTLRPEQQEEASFILDKAVDVVRNEPRDGIEPSKAGQLARLQDLLQRVEKIDSTFATSELFAKVVVRCAHALKLTSDDVPALRKVVGYRNVYVNNWIDNPRTFEVEPR